MLKPFVVALLMVTSLSLSSCSNGGSQSSETPTGGNETPKTSTEKVELQKYTSSTNGYEFMHPKTWKPEEAKGQEDKVDVAFRDPDGKGEALYVLVTKAPANKSLTDLGKPEQIAERLIKGINDNKDAKLTAELINTKTREANGKTFYIVEYKVKLPNNQERRNLAIIGVSQGKRITLNILAPEKRWNKLKGVFEEMANSFTVK